MENVYRDIAERTGGDVYIGVVGPVRTGKSTFIKRFMEELVLPHMKEGYARERARDEIPQAAAGKTVMTTEPKFVPDEAVPVSLDGCDDLRVRMVDCVGYLIPDVKGTDEEGKPRMVRTPWNPEPIPFTDAAEIGTKKVITDHATIGMLVTSDGTVGDIPRRDFEEAEERVVKELQEIGKPFAVILNSADPTREESAALAYDLEKKYAVPVALVCCRTLDGEDIKQILEMVLTEFPLRRMRIRLPEWVDALDAAHPVRLSLRESVSECLQTVRKIKDVKSAVEPLRQNPHCRACSLDSVDYGRGEATVTFLPADNLYYRVISETTGLDVSGERELITLMRDLAQTKRKFDKIEAALTSAEEGGYGIVMPEAEDLHLEEPRIVKEAGGYGVRLRASAKSIHMIRANIETEIRPVVGTEEQSEDFARYMMREYEGEPNKIWETNVFGKSLYDLVNEGIQQKLENMPEESRSRLSETLERILNEGSSGLICILL